MPDFVFSGNVHFYPSTLQLASELAEKSGRHIRIAEKSGAKDYGAVRQIARRFVGWERNAGSCDAQAWTIIKNNH